MGKDPVSTSHIRLSVVVPTYNRADLLRRNLHALLRQTLSPDLYEIIVVHQGPDKETPEVVRQLQHDNNLLRQVEEPRLGIAHALNAGLYAARGDILVCTDDDAFAPPVWLETVLRAFEETQPTPHAVGGPILPLVLGSRPPWFRDVYELRSWGEVPRFLASHERRFSSGNVAHRRDLLIAAGGFDPALGMKGDIMGFAEDDEIFSRLREVVGGDLRLYYQPAAYVWHAVPQHKMRVSYRLKRSFVFGQTKYQVAARQSGRGKGGAWIVGICRESYRLLRAIVRALAGTVRTRHFGDWLINYVLPLMHHAGYLAAAVGMRVKVRR